MPSAATTVVKGSPALRRSVTLLLALILTTLSIVPLRGLLTYGCTWDERVEFVELGEQVGVLGRILSGDFTPVVRATDAKVRKQYYGVVNKAPGIWFWRASQVLSGKAPQGWKWDQDAVAGFHLWSLLCLLITLWAAFRLAGRISGSSRLAWAAPLLLLLVPRFVGHSFFNIKDIPFAAAYTVASYAMVEAWLARDVRQGWRWTLAACLLCGIVAAIKVPALVVSWPLVVLAAARLASGRAGQDGRGIAAVWLLTPILSLAMAVAFNPSAWFAPMAWFRGAFGVFAQHPWGGCTMMFGACVPATDTPRWFLPAAFAVTTPIPVLALMLGGVAVSLAGLGKRWRARGLLSFVEADAAGAASWIAGAQLLTLPACAVLLRSNLHDYERLFLFVLPAACVLAAAAVTRLTQYGAVSARRRSVLAAAGTAGALVVLADMIALHPYEYTYYNEAARVLDLTESMETDYWGYSLGELARRQHQRDRRDPPPARRALMGHPVTALEPYSEGPIASYEIAIRDGTVTSTGRWPEVAVLALNRFAWRTTPAGCTETNRVERAHALGSGPMVMGRAFVCRRP